MRTQPQGYKKRSPHHAALAMRPMLQIPGLRASRWQIVSENSISISAGTALAKIDVVSSLFTITLKNVADREVRKLRGVGAGASVGPGLSPITLSGDPRQLSDLLSQMGFTRLTSLLRLIGAISDLPGSSSPIFLCPGRPDSLTTFIGAATVVSAGASIGVEGDVGVILFFDAHVLSNLILQAGSIEALGPLGGMVEAAVFAANVKAFAFFAGLDYCTDISVGIENVLYCLHPVSARA